MNKGFRKEHDFLGEVEVPETVYYGIQTVRALENYPSTGVRYDSSLYRAYAMVKKAAALANVEIGRLDPKVGEYIVKAAEEVIKGKFDHQFVTDPIIGTGLAVHMNVNEVIANRALELMGEDKGRYDIISPNSHVNMAQSTNDSMPTAVQIASYYMLEDLIAELEELVNSFDKKAKEFDHILKIGRTHLQDAVPIRLGQEFAAYGSVLRRDLNRISSTKTQLTKISLGGTAVGTGLNADPQYLALALEKLAGISGVQLKAAENLIDATQNSDTLLAVSAACRTCMVNMSKIANDIRLMASGPRCGLFEIELPARQPGSSIMPGKVNPGMVELINKAAFQVMGNDLTIMAACEAGQFELNVMKPVLVFNLFQTLKVMTKSFHVFRIYCLDGIKANEEILNRYVNSSVALMTAVSPYIGYEMSSKIAREAYTTGQSVRELCLKYQVLSEEQLDAILNVRAMTEPGIAGKKHK